MDSAVDLNVWARILSASDKVYKVDIEWGAMTFEYVTGKWDTELHAYSGEGSWSAGSVDGVNNKITLTNHSNGSVDANFAQSMESAVFGGDVTGGFYETETAAKEAAGKTPAESGALEPAELPSPEPPSPAEESAGTLDDLHAASLAAFACVSPPGTAPAHAPAVVVLRAAAGPAFLSGAGALWPPRRTEAPSRRRWLPLCNAAVGLLCGGSSLWLQGRAARGAPR